MKKTFSFLLILSLVLALLAGCKKAPEGPKDGAYNAAVTLSGGTGKATVLSPALLTVSGGKMTAEIVWSSKNYDYMLVDGVRYDAEIKDGHSVFVIPVAALDTDLAVTADTVAMSVPHEIEYTLRFDAASLEPVR